MGKPIADRGTMCPLWRKDVSKVCHKCHLWVSLPISTVDAAGVLVPSGHKWDCTFNQSNLLMLDILRSLDGVQKSQESFRNTAWKESQENLTALIEVSRGRGHIKLIEGN